MGSLLLPEPPKSVSEFYDIDSTRVSHREYWWGTKSPAVLIAWIIKWLRIRIPSSSDDPNVDSTLPFVTEGLPAGIDAIFQPLTAEITALGFVEPVFQVIHDPGTRTTVYWATFRHNSDQHFARIHHRVWHQTQKANRGLFPIFFTAFTDGTFLASSSGKPDFATPGAVQMNRKRGAKPMELWVSHQRQANALCGRKMISPVKTREDLLSTSERYHILVRDFNLARGVFRPRSAAEQAQAEAFTAAVAQARASGQEHPEVLAELERLQTKKPGWRTAIWVLLGSLVAFFAAGAANWDWKFTLWIIPVLLFHEAGHWVAMRLFHYRNLRMFFIPFFGAAVTGQNWNVPGWKKALVSLAGPVPGIALGTLFGVLGIVSKQEWLNVAALSLLFLNGLNLLPILPLDGGHIFQDTLFCRNRWLDGAFRILAVFGLIVLGLSLRARLLAYLAIPMALSLPLAFRLGKITDTLRRQPLPPPLPGEDRIPAPTANAIIEAVRAAFPAKLTLSHKATAQHTLNVFERINARPPSLVATIGLLALHGGAFLLALLVTVLVLVGQHGGLGDFLTAAARQPRHAFGPGDIETWRSNTPAEPGAVRTLLVTTLKNREAAIAAFAELTNRTPSSSSLVRFGDSLFLSLPSQDEAARERWFDELQARSTNTFAAVSNAPVTVSLNCIAPSKVALTNLITELRDYFTSAALMELIAPWSPEASQPGFARCRHARQQWSTIAREEAKVWRDPLLKPYSAKITIAIRRGSTTELDRLIKEQSEKAEELQAEVRERLRSRPNDPIDPALLDLHVKLNSADVTNRVERQRLLREVAGRLGEVNYTDDAPAPGANAYSVRNGFAAPHGLLVEVRLASFCDPTRGLPAMAEWLHGLGCRQIKYDLEGTFWNSDVDGKEE